MKKLLLTTLSIAIGFGAMAQENLKLKNQGIRDNATVKGKAKITLSKAASEEWYNPLDILADGGFKTYVGFMMNDSMAKYVGSDGVASQSRTFQGVGTIIDPKDDAILLGDNPGMKMSKFTNYSVDSIQFTYGYVRRNDSTSDGLGNFVPVVDTLFVFYYSGTQVIKSAKQSWSTSPYGTFGYNFARRRPANFLTTDTILLTKEYSTGLRSTQGWSQKVITLAPKVAMKVNANGGLNSNNLVGFSILFKNGTKYDTSYTFEDLRDSALVPKSTKFVNYFLYRTGVNEGAVLPTSTFYNSSVVTPQRFSYASINGWNGWYSGQGFEEAQIIDAGAKLSSDNISVKEVPNLFSLIDAYPNPASNDVTIAFDLKSANNVKISLVNLLGQEILNIANDRFLAGNNSVKFNVENLKAGVYFYTMTVNGVSQSQKMIIK